MRLVMSESVPTRPGGRWGNPHQIAPKVAESLRVYEYNKRLEGLNKRLPDAPAVGGFLPPPLGVRVTGLAPDDTKVVSNPRYTSQ